MTQITQAGIEYKPVFTHSLQFGSQGACTTLLLPPRAARPLGSIVTNTTTGGAQAPATSIEQFMNSPSQEETQNSAPYRSLQPSVLSTPLPSHTPTC